MIENLYEIYLKKMGESEPSLSASLHVYTLKLVSLSSLDIC